MLTTIKYNFLDCDFLCGRFPELREKIIAENEWLGEKLPHCLFGNILNLLVTELLKKDDYRNNNLLERIFRMYEELAEYGDTETKNLLQVTLLEYLWDEYITYSRALELMGKETKLINQSIDYLKIPEVNYGNN
ncbi:MAG: hypothetical protein K2H28_06750 [Ruminococcus sp.]|nr:hypothetical protein [Ruminococcus sp.]